MTTREYANRDGFRFRFGRTGSDNAYVETEDGQRYIFGRFAESELAEFFGERKAAQPDRDEFPRVQGTCPSCGVGPLFLGEGGHVTCSWVDCEAPEAADETLQIGLTVAQPDRPEPVDPASVRVGDIVDYETTVEYRLCRIIGEVEQTAEHVTGEDGTSLKIHNKWWNCTIATVRILQRPEPVPDEAAVEALYEALRDVYPRAVWDLREAANTLARRNVRVVSEVKVLVAQLTAERDEAREALRSVRETVRLHLGVSDDGARTLAQRLWNVLGEQQRDQAEAENWLAEQRDRETP